MPLKRSEWEKGKFKLSFEEVLEALDLWKQGTPYDTIAGMYGASRSSVYRALCAAKKMMEGKKLNKWCGEVLDKDGEGYRYEVFHPRFGSIAGWFRGSKKQTEEHVRRVVRDRNRRMRGDAKWTL